MSFLGNLVLTLVGIMFQMTHICYITHITHLIAQMLQILDSIMDTLTFKLYNPAPFLSYLREINKTGIIPLVFLCKEGPIRATLYQPLQFSFSP